MSRPDGAAWNGRNGQIDAALLAAAVPEIASHRAHICGPPAMMDAVKSALIGLGMAEEQIKTEAFGTIKRDPTAKGGPSTAIAGNVFFQASNTSAPVFVGAIILDVPTRPEFSSIMPAARGRAVPAVSSSPGAACACRSRMRSPRKIRLAAISSRARRRSVEMSWQTPRVRS